MKIIAIYGGPAGVAMYSQLRQAAHWFVTLATLQGHGSIAYRAASLSGDVRNTFLSTVATLYVIGAASAGISLIFFANTIANALFGEATPALTFAIRLSAAGVLVGAIASFSMGVLLGIGGLRTVVVLQLTGAMAAAVLAYPIARSGEASDYVVLFTATYFASALVGVIGLKRQQLIARLRLGINVSALKSHLSYAGATLGIVFLTMATFVTIRALCIRILGLERTGLVDAAFTISGLFAHALLMPLEQYWFPRLAGNQQAFSDLSSYIDQALKLSILGAVIGVAFAAAFRNELLQLFYSSDFRPASEILRWMLIGDFFRITGWTLRVCLLARGDKTGVLTGELILCGTLVVPVIIGLESDWQVIGAAYALANAVWLLYIVLRLREWCGICPSKTILGDWFAGLAIVFAVTVACWTDSGSNTDRATLIWITAVTFFMVYGFFSARRARSTTEP
jgi:PST family polysaccharide transporter